MPSIKPSNALASFLLLGAGLAIFNTVSKEKPAPKPKVQAAAPAKVEQCVSCEDLAAVQSELDATKKRLSSVERDVAWLNSRVQQSAPVKLIPTTPVRKPVATKPVGHWATVCDGNSCRQVWKTGPAPKAVQKSSACSGGSCSFGRGLFGRRR